MSTWSYGRIIVLCLIPWSSYAAVFPVTTTNDVINGADGVLSLREAVIAANANAGDDTIQLDAVTYRLSLWTTNRENNDMVGDLDLTDVTGLTIVEGVGPQSSIIDGLFLQNRIFHVLNSVTGVFRSINLWRGRSLNGFALGGTNPVDAVGGSSVFNEGTLSMSNCSFVGNISGRHLHRHHHWMGIQLPHRHHPHHDRHFQ